MNRSPIPDRVVRRLSGTALIAICAIALQRQPARAESTADERMGDGRVSSFYDAPRAVPARLGTVIRTEPVPATLRLPEAESGRRIVYSSRSGVDGTTPIAVSGEIFEPHGTPPAGGWPIVAWAHGTTGIADICAPSWAARSDRDVVYLDHWLAQGYAIVATDYQGLGTPGMHPYLNVRAEAYGVLDAVRAALSSDPRLRNRVVIVGQSQGGGAAFGAAAYAASYAPEIDVRGTVATGVPYFAPTVPSAGASDPTKVDAGIAYLFYIVLGVQTPDTTLDAATYFQPAALPLYELARVTCIDALEDDVRLAGLTDAGSLTPQFEKLLAAHLPDYEFPTLKIATPVFIGTGLDDSDVRPAVQERLVKDACAAGTIVEAHEYAGLTHGQTVNASLRDSIPFVAAVFAGRSIAPICSPTPQ